MVELGKLLAKEKKCYTMVNIPETQVLWNGETSVL